MSRIKNVLEALFSTWCWREHMPARQVIELEICMARFGSPI